MSFCFVLFSDWIFPLSLENYLLLGDTAKHSESIKWLIGDDKKLLTKCGLRREVATYLRVHQGRKSTLWKAYLPPAEI